MSNKMLIDASHPEETRVVVLRGNRVEEFDFEAADRQQLRGNIYLAKVTRVEPSLQAAFIEYGGNRHGFLAFSEIHPDYYQIPYADRQALLQEHAEEAAAEARREDEQARREGEPSAEAEADSSETSAEEDAAEEPGAEAASDGEAPPEEAGDEAEPGQPEAMLAATPAPKSVSAPADSADSRPAQPEQETEEHAEAENEEDVVESVGAEDALEELPERRAKPRPRQYKIQEVIKRRQVLLVQVVKEERGNKGAALTTYLSLAGRYSVLMPNTARGGGISRKITTPTDRKRLKAIASELDVPEGMGVILRTAGANRTKSEIKRDFEYLLRLWENVRELTLQSTAPKLVYEEGSLIKRAIRDLYSREIEQVVVAGEPAYREAKDFMRMLMPSHARNVQLYRDETPIFSRSGVEAQLDAMFSPQVTLKSGGYIVINQTEALVSIDVNSGRSTREHSIEDTALNTNLEAAEEIARQLRLRDLAGLIVIDFIDMEEKRNNRSVERRLKDCLRVDRARIQVGRISHFGLMEMSRQRIRTGVLESSTVPCPHCRGTGQVRSISSLSLQILRAVEDSLLRHSGHHLLVRTRPEVALYVLNQKRLHLAQLEQRFGVSIAVSGETPENGAGFTVERGAPVEDRPDRSGAIAMRDMPPLEIEEEAAGEDLADAEDETSVAASGGERDRRRRRRRRRGNGDDRHHRHAVETAGEDEEAPASEEEQVEREAGGPAESAAEREVRRRRRGRRGGKRRGRGRENGERTTDRVAESGATEDFSDDDEASPASQQEEWSERDGEPFPVVPGTADVAQDQEDDDMQPSNAEPDAWPVAAKPPSQPEEVVASDLDSTSVAESPPPAEDDDRPKRSGWWSRKSSFF